MITCAELLNLLNELAPLKLAEQWDNCGLLVGDPRQEVKGILVCLDVSHNVLEEALTQGANVILSHHPLIFKPLKGLRLDKPQGQILARIIKNDLQIIALHTNYDQAREGVSVQLARILGLVDTQVLQPKDLEKLYKLVVFVPTDYEAQVREAMGNAGAGHIGNYSHCTFRAAGTGTFLPLEGTNPFLGTQGQLEEAAEYRLETIVPESLLSQVIEAMLAAHPYEEVAYDLIPLANRQEGYGLGRVGRLPAPLKLRDFVQQVKSQLSLSAVKVAGDPEREITQVAVCGGSGKSLIPLAAQAGAQVLVTGELGHHDAQLAQELGLALVDAGHYATEAVSLPFLVEALKDKLEKGGFRIPVVLSQKEQDPWQVF